MILFVAPLNSRRFTVIIIIPMKSAVRHAQWHVYTRRFGHAALAAAVLSEIFIVFIVILTYVVRLIDVCVAKAEKLNRVRRHSVRMLNGHL